MDEVRKQIESLSTQTKLVVTVGVGVLATLLHPATRRALLLRSWHLWSATPISARVGAAIGLLIALFKKYIWGSESGFTEQAQPQIQIGYDAEGNAIPVVYCNQEKLAGYHWISFDNFSCIADWKGGIPTGRVRAWRGEVLVVNGECNDFGELMSGVGIRYRNRRVLPLPLGDSPPYWEKGTFRNGELVDLGKRLSGGVLWQGIFSQGTFGWGEKIRVDSRRVEAMGHFNAEGLCINGYQREIVEGGYRLMRRRSEGPDVEVLDQENIAAYFDAERRVDEDWESLDVLSDSFEPLLICAEQLREEGRRRNRADLRARLEPLLRSLREQRPGHSL